MTMMPTTRWRFGKREVGPPSRAWTGQIRLGACGEDIPMGAACNRYYRHHHPHSHSHHLHHHHHHHHQIIIIILIIIIWMIIIILIIDCHLKNTLPFALFCWHSQVSLREIIQSMHLVQLKVPFLLRRIFHSLSRLALDWIQCIDCILMFLSSLNFSSTRYLSHHSTIIITVNCVSLFSTLCFTNSFYM